MPSALRGSPDLVFQPPHRSVAWHLTWRYVVSLVVIALLSFTGQVVVQIYLRQNENDARIINLAGRQRMLSQRLAKAAYQHGGPNREELDRSLKEFVQAHRGLRSGDEELELPPISSPAFERAFAELQPHFAGLTTAVSELLKTDLSAADQQRALQMIDRHERRFLKAMDEIVFLLDREARRRVAQVEMVEFALFIVLSIVLVGEALFVFRPAVARTRQSIKALIQTRDALAASEADQQATLQAFPDTLARLAGDGQLTLLKASDLSLFERSLPAGAMLAPDDLPPRFRAALAACRQDAYQTKAVATQHVVLSDDPVQAYEIRVSPSRGRGNVAVIRDISEQLRLETEVLEATDRTQAQVGQELHDGLCQHLAGLALLARARSDDSATDEVVQLLDEGVAQAREIARGLYPATLRNLGLNGALEELVRHIETISDLTCEEIFPDSPVEVSDETARQIYRIAQEATANAVRHAHARKLTVRLAKEKEWLLLEISDDGRGFDAQQKQIRGLGLDTMAYRARLLNGEIKIVNPESGGTIVRCRIPNRGGSLSLNTSEASG
ncbi:MAG: type IV pili methyl-accepting chemotaxis transducer N-terminal domain-containing protein [Myxococcota bacterium]